MAREERAIDLDIAGQHYEVTCECINCDWKGPVRITKGVKAPKGVPLGADVAVCENCGCASLRRSEPLPAPRVVQPAGQPGVRIVQSESEPFREHIRRFMQERANAPALPRPVVTPDPPIDRWVNHWGSWDNHPLVNPTRAAELPPGTVVMIDENRQARPLLEGNTFTPGNAGQVTMGIDWAGRHSEPAIVAMGLTRASEPDPNRNGDNFSHVQAVMHLSHMGLLSHKSALESLGVDWRDMAAEGRQEAQAAGFDAASVLNSEL